MFCGAEVASSLLAVAMAVPVVAMEVKVPAAIVASAAL
jgi:hypothetical protein